MALSRSIKHQEFVSFNHFCRLGRVPTLLSRWTDPDYIWIRLTRVSFSQCSFADCVNYKKSQEPFYLHPPSSVTSTMGHHQQHQQTATGRGKVAAKDGLYVNPMGQHKMVATPTAVQAEPKGPFYLHNPNGVTDDPVKDIFDKSAAVAKTPYPALQVAAPPPPPLPAIGPNTMTGKTSCTTPLIIYLTIITCTVRMCAVAYIRCGGGYLGDRSLLIDFLMTILVKAFIG